MHWSSLCLMLVRRARQDASHELAELAHVAPLAFEEHWFSYWCTGPEAQTRWEVLDALANLSAHFGDQVFKAFDAVRLLCLTMTQLNGASQHFCSSASTVQLHLAFLMRRGLFWMKTRFQCYHGDATRYHDMLQGLLALAHGTISRTWRRHCHAAYEVWCGKCHWIH